jgi:hypothetical protein
VNAHCSSIESFLVLETSKWYDRSCVGQIVLVARHGCKGDEVYKVGGLTENFPVLRSCAWLWDLAPACCMYDRNACTGNCGPLGRELRVCNLYITTNGGNLVGMGLSISAAVWRFERVHTARIVEMLLGDRDALYWWLWRLPTELYVFGRERGLDGSCAFD